MKRPVDAAIALLWLATTALMPVALWAVFLHAPDERVMGAAQRIFYFHVPSAILTFAGVFVLLGSAVAYLWTRNLRWDNLARASTEASWLFCTIVLATGPLWARPAWGVWWTWEAKLTTTMILWLLLSASMMVRGYAGHREAGARLAAVIAIVAAVDVPIIHKATVWWRGQHPVVFQPNQEGALSPRMAIAFQICLITFTVLFALIVALRYRVAEVEDRCAMAAERLGRARGV